MMHRSRPFMLAAIVVAAPLGHADAAGVLDALTWKARPVVVLSESPDDPNVARQLAAFDRVRPALGERAITVLREAWPATALRKRLGIATRGFAVVLVGKDGDVKHVWHEVVEPRRVFEVIDRMPMRRDEMRG